jgi:hypothetical protein
MHSVNNLIIASLTMLYLLCSQFFFTSFFFLLRSQFLPHFFLPHFLLRSQFVIIFYLLCSQCFTYFTLNLPASLSIYLLRSQFFYLLRSQFTYLTNFLIISVVNILE